MTKKSKKSRKFKKKTARNKLRGSQKQRRRNIDCECVSNAAATDLLLLFSLSFSKKQAVQCAFWSTVEPTYSAVSRL